MPKTEDKLDFHIEFRVELTCKHWDLQLVESQRLHLFQNELHLFCCCHHQGPVKQSKKETTMIKQIFNDWVWLLSWFWVGFNVFKMWTILRSVSFFDHLQTVFFWSS